MDENIIDFHEKVEEERNRRKKEIRELLKAPISLGDLIACYDEELPGSIRIMDPDLYKRIKKSHLITKPILQRLKETDEKMMTEEAIDEIAKKLIDSINESKDLLNTLREDESEDLHFPSFLKNGMMWEHNGIIYVIRDGKWEEVISTEDFARTCFLAEQENMSFNEYIRHKIEEHMKAQENEDGRE